MIIAKLLEHYLTTTFSLNKCNFSYLFDPHCRLVFSQTCQAAHQ